MFEDRDKGGGQVDAEAVDKSVSPNYCAKEEEKQEQVGHDADQASRRLTTQRKVEKKERQSANVQELSTPRTDSATSSVVVVVDLKGRSPPRGRGL